MKDIKKILTIILAISLLFAISCGDRPTGSTPGAGDGLVSSTPTATGSEVKNFADAIYTGTLTFDDTGFEFIGDAGGGDEEAMKQEKKNDLVNSKMRHSLTIANNMVTFKSEVPTYESATTYKEYLSYFKDAPLKLKEDRITYNASYEINNESTKNKYYIEFIKNGDSLNSFKFIEAHSVNGFNVDENINMNYGMKITYTAASLSKNP